MDKSWKAFTIVVSSLLAAIIVCTAVNVSVNKVTAGVSSLPSQDNGQQQTYDGQDQIYVDPNQQDGQNVDVNTDINTDVPQEGQTVQNNNQTPQQNNVKPQQNTQQAQQTGDNPLNYNKAQIAAYYNSCLKKTYSQPKFTVTKTEVIDVQLGEMMLNGKPATGIQGMANDIVAKNAAKGGTKTQSFTNQNAVVDAQKRFILPANLNANAIKSFNVNKSGAGYVINFTLNQESCDFRVKPPYNACCTFPLDFTEIDLGSLGQITSAQFFYPGTTLQATIDGQGRVVKTYVVMPLTVDNAEGKGLGQTLNMDISGRWLCTNVNTF